MYQHNNNSLINRRFIVEQLRHLLVTVYELYLLWRKSALALLFRTKDLNYHFWHTWKSFNVHRHNYYGFLQTYPKCIKSLLMHFEKSLPKHFTPQGESCIEIGWKSLIHAALFY